MKKSILNICFVLIFNILFSQIENKEQLKPFTEKLTQKEDITQILFLGDSHIQADWLTSHFRQMFQNKYGNAGRGLVFPYALANSNGPEDISSYSNQTWDNFRLVYEQDIFPQMGASGFVIGNQKKSILELNLNQDFSKVIIFNDNEMAGKEFEVFNSSHSLKNYINKKTERTSYQIQNGETFPELASKFYTTTTKLKILNGSSIQNPKAGTWIKADKINIHYNPDFENHLQFISKNKFENLKTEVTLPRPQRKLIIKTDNLSNIFYGFQFLNGKKGVVFNSIGVNGATYQDFLKYPIQFQQLKSLSPDLIIIALGTNESLSSISKEEFKSNATQLIQLWKKEDLHLPILLISPTDNHIKPQKIKEIANWISEVAIENNVSFLNLYQEMGGAGYFKKALLKKEANADGVHFLKTGYENQAKKIWQTLEEILP